LGSAKVRDVGWLYNVFDYSFTWMPYFSSYLSLRSFCQFSGLMRSPRMKMFVTLLVRMSSASPSLMNSVALFPVVSVP